MKGYKEGSLSHLEEHENGGWLARLRYTDKEAEEFLNSQSMFGLNKDELGYYSITGELVCTID